MHTPKRGRITTDQHKAYAKSQRQYELEIPSSPESGVNLVGGFSVQEDMETTILLDFDAQQSVHLDSDQYILQPTIKIIKVDKQKKQSIN